MKKLIHSFILSLILATGATVQAENLLQCIVPESPDINFVTLELGDEPSRDYLTFTLMKIDLNSEIKSLADIPTSYLFTISEKGTFSKQMQAGGITSIVFTEEVTRKGNVIANAGFFTIAKSEEDDTYLGFMSIHNNLYFLVCTTPEKQ